MASPNAASVQPAHTTTTTATSLDTPLTPLQRKVKIEKEEIADLPELPSEDNTFYAAKAILKETEVRYLIAWKGVNPETGRAWEPTWEPKRFANDELLAAWVRKRNARGKKTVKRAGRGRKVSTKKPLTLLLEIPDSQESVGLGLRGTGKWVSSMFHFLV